MREKPGPPEIEVSPRLRSVCEPPFSYDPDGLFFTPTTASPLSSSEDGIFYVTGRRREKGGRYTGSGVDIYHPLVDGKEALVTGIVMRPGLGRTVELPLGHISLLPLVGTKVSLVLGEAVDPQKTFPDDPSEIDVLIESGVITFSSRDGEGNTFDETTLRPGMPARPVFIGRAPVSVSSWYGVSSALFLRHTLSDRGVSSMHVAAYRVGEKNGLETSYLALERLSGQPTAIRGTSLKAI